MLCVMLSLGGEREVHKGNKPPCIEQSDWSETLKYVNIYYFVKESTANINVLSITPISCTKKS